jgi:hypothetical protein
LAYLQQNPSHVYTDGDGFRWSWCEWWASNEDQLVLRITAPSGEFALVPDFTITGPAGRPKAERAKKLEDERKAAEEARAKASAEREEKERKYGTEAGAREMAFRAFGEALKGARFRLHSIPSRTPNVFLLKDGSWEVWEGFTRKNGFGVEQEYVGKATVRKIGEKKETLPLGGYTVIPIWDVVGVEFTEKLRGAVGGSG